MHVFDRLFFLSVHIGSMRVKKNAKAASQKIHSSIYCASHHTQQIIQMLLDFFPHFHHTLSFSRYFLSTDSIVNMITPEW